MDRNPRNLNQMKCDVIYFFFLCARERLQTLEMPKPFKNVSDLASPSSCPDLLCSSMRQSWLDADEFLPLGTTSEFA